MAAFCVAQAPSNAWAPTNLVAVNPGDFSPQVQYIAVNTHFIFSIKSDPSIQPRHLGFNAFHRRFAQFSLNQEVTVEVIDPIKAFGPSAYLGSVTVEVGFFRKSMEDSKQYDTGDMAKLFVQSFANQVLMADMQLILDFHGVALTAIVKSVEAVDVSQLKSDARGAAPERSDAGRGILMPQTVVHFTKQAASSIRLKGSSGGGGTSILKPNFKFEDMGIGGLDKEFESIFRRAFASRLYPPSIAQKVGIPHVKGILLYGPPGTGKTLIARQIGKMLNAREPIVVNGPEVLNKFVGQSEENIRKLFVEAEKEYKAKGEDSGLHIIIFDELDAICKQRGSKNDGTGVGDSVVNQLLSKLDGVEQLNNILIIGMTNRMDMIDEALLRPGRLEVHIEISLPDENGRVQILKIHTARMREHNILDPDVDIPELASLTKNFSGAEISGLVKSAASFAFNRHVKVGAAASVSSDAENMKVMRADFLNALDEVRPSFGVSESELTHLIQNQIIHFSPNIERILTEGQTFVEQARSDEQTSLVSLLLHGTPASGKTALAATIAMASEFPFVKLITPETMVGMSESAKVSALSKTFDQAYKSPLSVIVIDDLEGLLDWVDIGPRFSNAVLQAMRVLLRRIPPKGRRLFVVATTNERAVLDQMKLAQFFDGQLYVPTITQLQEVDVVLQHVKGFSAADRAQALMQLRALEAGIGGQKINVGIKKLLFICANARQDAAGMVDKFVNTLAGHTF